VSWQVLLVALLGSVLLLMTFGLPVVFAFLAVDIIGAWLVLGGHAGMELLVRNALDGVTSYTLVSIPLFVFMGEMLFQSRLAIKAIDAVNRMISRVPGRLAVVSIVAGTIFSAISGSTVATTVMLGSLLLPEMIKRGYSPRLSMGAIMGIGGVDMLIPPSALAVLLGSLAVINISDLLLAGVVPGLILSVAFVAYIVTMATIFPEQAPPEAAEELSLRERWLPFVGDVMPLVLIFVIVILSMARGWASPTEAAAVGATATTLIAIVYRAFTFQSFVKALHGTATITGAILLIIMGAATFSQILNFSGASSGLVNTILTSVSDRWMVLLCMMGILIVLGFFVDQVSIMLITLPFYMPIVQKFGIDPVWFGVLFMMCIQIGLLHPPFGLILFAMRSVAPEEIPTKDIFLAAIPYLIMSMLMLIAIMLWPGIATWLPRGLG
jgi:tripartite ATP-independent transporter DctM subunit